MADDGPSDLQRQVDELVAAVAANRIEITALIQRAEASDQRAEASDQRANAAQRRADDAEVRVNKIEARSAVDRELIAELQADGVLSQAHVADLEAALVSSRTIGAALGILMANRNIGLEEALVLLKGTSQRTNTKMRELAAIIVAGADAIK